MFEETNSQTYTGPQMGWVRRKDLDTASVDMWEMPDGTMVDMERGRPPLIRKVTIRLSDG